MKILIALALLLVPSLARADLTFKCRTVKHSEALAATLRFSESGRNGHIELELWNGYPPLTLVYADLKDPRTKAGRTILQSDADQTWGRTAKVSLPQDYAGLDDFLAEIEQTSAAGRVSANAFHCNRF